MASPKVTVVISFYNNVQNLKWMLAGFERQSFKDFEIIIADDGSKKEVVDEISEFKDRYAFPVYHSWHEDIGWRKNIALNKAIKTSTGGYIVFCDGDCIPHRHFVREHYLNGRDGIILTGRRVYLAEAYSKKLNEKYIRRGGLENVFKLLIKNSWQTENGLFIPRKLINPYHIKRDNKKKILGCNFSIHRSTLEAVNGFDERYLEPCVGEDTDLDTRLRMGGYRIRSVKHLAIQYHIYHRKVTRDGEERNFKILNDSIARGIVKTPYGLEPFESA